MKRLKLILPAVTALVLTGCGGGGGGTTVSGGAASDADLSGQNQEPVQSGDELTGRFVDSAVAGLPYTTETRSGETDTDGTFAYEAGEMITFSIGGIVLPAVSGADIITPLTVFSTDDITDIRVMNLARLLQTLDTDGDPDNGIALADQAIASATGLNVDFSASAEDFSSQVVNLVANSGSINTELVNGIEALDHLQETLFVEGLDERPEQLPSMEEQLQEVNPNNTSTHPLVGTSSEFTTRAHDVSGTLTILDDRTIMISNFNYDADGVNVFFYYGTDGNYSAGGPIGTRLNGRPPYVNETIVLTIPDGLTLDDFNGISVWCIPFDFDFGDARF